MSFDKSSQTIVSYTFDVYTIFQRRYYYFINFETNKQQKMNRKKKLNKPFAFVVTESFKVECLVYTSLCVQWDPIAWFDCPDDVLIFAEDSQSPAAIILTETTRESRKILKKEQTKSKDKHLRDVVFCAQSNLTVKDQFLYQSKTN